MRIAIIGPGANFAGGIADFSTSLARNLYIPELTEVMLFSWKHPFPGIIKNSESDNKIQTKFPNREIHINYCLDHKNFLSWRKSILQVKKFKPTILIFQWIENIPSKFTAYLLKNIKNCEIIIDTHFEKNLSKSKIDAKKHSRTLKYADTYIVHSFQEAETLIHLFPKQKFNIVEQGRGFEEEGKTILKLFHPLYKRFHKNPDFNKDEFKAELGLNSHVFLFFGFIKKYKGLHNAIKALSIVKQQYPDISLLIAGKLPEDDPKKNDYNPFELIKNYNLEENTVIVDKFIPEDEVYKYFQVSDSILLFYNRAITCGIVSIANNFGVPALATAIGPFPENIIHRHNGMLASPDNVSSMAEIMIESIENPIDNKNVSDFSKNMSWENYAKKILSNPKSYETY